MNSETSEGTKLDKPSSRWQRSRAAQLVALILGVGPLYYAVLQAHLVREQAPGMQDVIAYTLGFGSAVSVIMLVVLRVVCGERPRDLNLAPGRWTRDVAMGTGLGILTLASLPRAQRPRRAALPPRTQPGHGRLLRGAGRRS